MLRKHQRMRDRKRIGERQRSLSSLSFFSCPVRCSHLTGDISNLNMFVFEDKEKTGVFGEKPLEAAFTPNNNLKPHMASTHATSTISTRKFEVVIVLYCFGYEPPQTKLDRKERTEKGGRVNRVRCV